MAVLTVIPDNINKYGELISRISGTAKEARSYIDKHDADFGGFSGRLGSYMFPSHDKAMESTEKMLKHLGTIADQSDINLGKTANYYRNTEHKVAAEVDSTYPAKTPTLTPQELTESHYSELTGRTLATQNFADVADPRSALKEPEAIELSALAKFVNNPGGPFDYLSPSNAVCKILELVTHHDIIEWLTEWFAGDWKKCYECGEAFENVGAMMEFISTNIIKGVNELKETWAGNVADSALAYFSDLSVAVSEQREVLDELGNKYKITAMGICRLEETAAGIYKGMIDAAIVAAAAASAGVATAETGVGGPLGGLVSGVEVARIWEMWERLKLIPEKATQAGNSFVGFALNATSRTANFTKHPLPAAGYKSPMA